jgi:hypothetical protein
MDRRSNLVILIYLLGSPVHVIVIDAIYATEMHKLRISKIYFLPTSLGIAVEGRATFRPR